MAGRIVKALAVGRTAIVYADSPMSTVPGSSLQFASYTVAGILFIVWFGWTALALRQRPSS